MRSWTSHLPEILSSVATRDVTIPSGVRFGTDAYLVPSPDRRDLQFAFPVCISSRLAEEIPLPFASSSGAVHAIIEHCKAESLKNPELGMLYGRATGNRSRYSVHIEPCTIASSRSHLAANLWRPDEQNYLSQDGVHLVLRGALPYSEPDSGAFREISSVLRLYTEAMAGCVMKTPLHLIRKEWESVLDQQQLRSDLQEMGLICIIGDGTRPARAYTRHRSWYRVAGPKTGVHVPFCCPEESDPVEISLKGSNRRISGLGIRRGELFAITGSNAQGKSTLLQAILAGEDDHAPGDGREHLVTVPGGAGIDATSIELHGADLRPFFTRIPPGMTGDAASAFGQGSGSASMACRFSEALRLKSPYIIIDEDRSAQNLVVPCFMTLPEIQSLAVLLKKDREWLGGTTVLIAGSGMELLISRADRIIRLKDHKAGYLSPDEYREGLGRYYEEMKRLV